VPGRGHVVCGRFAVLQVQVRLIAIYPRSRLPLKHPRFCDSLQQLPLITLSPTTSDWGALRVPQLVQWLGTSSTVSRTVAFATCPWCGGHMVSHLGVTTSCSPPIHHCHPPLHILGNRPNKSPTKRSCGGEEPGVITCFISLHFPSTRRQPRALSYP